jgi:hypothetical protein
MVHVNEFTAIRGEITAMYTAENAPFGAIIGRSGNAVLIQLKEGVAVISKPRCDGDIAIEVCCSNAPYIDISWAF